MDSESLAYMGFCHVDFMHLRSAQRQGEGERREGEGEEKQSRKREEKRVGVGNGNRIANDKAYSADKQLKIKTKKDLYQPRQLRRSLNSPCFSENDHYFCIPLKMSSGKKSAKSSLTFCSISKYSILC